MATTYLHRTPSSTFAGTKYTFSGWFKRGDLTARNCMLWASSDGGSADYTEIEFKADNTLHWANKANGGTAGNLITTRLFRDPAAWYHLVFAWDTTASAADRMRIYVNGVEETSFGTDTNPGSGDTGCSLATSGDEVDIGKQNASTYFYNGVMAHLHLCMGNAYAASDFGETDATSGIWIAKSGPSVTYGDDGFFLKMASGALGTDSSGEGNTFTVSGTMTTTKDNPDNNFATWNPLQNYYDPATLANGNTKFTTTGGTLIYAFRTSTIGMTSGKWYCEILRGGTADYATVGIASRFPEASNDWLGVKAGNYAWQDWNGKVYSNSAEVADWGEYDGDVVVMIGLDLDNNKLYLGQDGVWENSADPAGGTGGLSITAPSDTFSGCYHFAAGDADNAFGHIFNGNFGNGYFGTTAVTSAVADGNGEGQFEYAPPTGFFALCTNNLGSES